MEILGLASLTFVAAIVGTLSGFGMSTIMTTVLVLFLPPVQAIFLVAIVHWFGDLWKILLFRQGLNLRLLLLFGVTGIATSYAGAAITLGTNTGLLLRLLCAFLTAYGAIFIFKTRFKIPAGTGVALTGGALSGFFAGMFGTGGAIRGAFLTAFDLPKAIYIATAGAIGMIVDSTRIITFAAGGTVLPGRLWWSLALLIPVSLGGAEVGKLLVDRIPQEQFRRVVAAFILVIGLKILLFP
jgi:uncharacterized protein